jgi:hypothetical protein
MLFLATASEAQMPVTPLKSKIAVTQWRRDAVRADGALRADGAVPWPGQQTVQGYDWDAKGKPCPG